MSASCPPGQSTEPGGDTILATGPLPCVLLGSPACGHQGSHLSCSEVSQDQLFPWPLSCPYSWGQRKGLELKVEGRVLMWLPRDPPVPESSLSLVPPTVRWELPKFYTGLCAMSLGKPWCWQSMWGECWPLESWALGM